MSTDQEYWDACLIKAWRDGITMRGLLSMFYSITKKLPSDCSLLRSPYNCYTPPSMGVKLFVAQRLPKIGTWLFDKPRDRDVELLKKLSASKYDVLKEPVNTEYDNEIKNERRRLRTSQKRTAMSGLAYSNRNYDTDWNVTKGARSKSR
jgi:hypothetical protein